MPATCNRRNLVVLIVFIALLLDNLLLTCLVPIMPNYLRENHPPPEPNHGDHSLTITTTTVQPLHSVRDPVLTEHPSHLWSNVVKANNFSIYNVTKEIEKENTRMGILIGVKTFAQLIVNFFVGYLTNRIGYTIPMFSGFVILLGSTLLFAFAETYIVLVVSRAIQGIGTALSTTSGMGLLAQLFPDQRERGLAQTIAFSGLAAGVLIGPPYGGVLYDWTGGKEIPCLILAGVTLLEGVLQLIVIRPRYQREERRGSSFFKLLIDPYIFVTAVCITLSSLTVAVLEPILPIWMFNTMGAPAWLQGVAFVPSTLSYLLCLQIIGTVTHRMQSYTVSHRWISAFVGILLQGGSIAVVPLCADIYDLIAPLFINGLGLALVTSSMLPHVGYLVDHRHEPVYGSAYALTDNAFCFAFAVGPAISGPMVDSIGFAWTLISLGALSILTAPIVCFLRNPPRRVTQDEEEAPLLPKIVAFSPSAERVIDN